MQAAKYDITINQGADFSLDLVIRDEGVVRDLTNYFVRGELRTSKLADSVTATFVCTIPTPLLGEINISIPNATTTGITPGVYWYDIELYTASDVTVDRLLEGRATVTANVTRP